MTIENQKLIADEVLERLFLIDPYAICAGGAPRDWYFGKEAMDLDIFFYAPQASTVGLMKKMLNTSGFDVKEVLFGDTIPEWYKKNPDLKAVYNVSMYGVDVQLIRMSKPTWKSVLSNFPLNICQAFYKNGKCTYTKEFMRSVKYNIIYKTNTLYNDGHTYLKKIIAKFPEYKYYNSFTDFVDKEL